MAAKTMIITAPDFTAECQWQQTPDNQWECVSAKRPILWMQGMSAQDAKEALESVRWSYRWKTDAVQ